MSTLENIFSQFLGPLDASYCNLFLVFSLISLVTLLLALFSLVGTLLYSKPSTWFTKIMAAVAAQFFALIFYFQNRLLYGMCINTL